MVRSRRSLCTMKPSPTHQRNSLKCVQFLGNVIIDRISFLAQDAQPSTQVKTISMLEFLVEKHKSEWNNFADRIGYSESVEVRQSAS